MHQVEVVARGAHGDGERGAAEPDLQRLLGRDRVRTRCVRGAADAQHRGAAGDSSHAATVLTGSAPTVPAMSPLPPFTAVVLAGGRAARLGGQAKPQLEVGGRSMLAAVLTAVRRAPAPGSWSGRRSRCRRACCWSARAPPGGGPVPALAAGLAAAGDAEVVAVLAADLPFVTAGAGHRPPRAAHRRRRARGRRHRPRPVAARGLAHRGAARRDRRRAPARPAAARCWRP